MGLGKGGTILAGEVYAEAKEYGYDNGYSIGSDNVFEYGRDDYDQYFSDVSEHESDGFRQFSPFEFFAQLLNSQSDFVRDRAWDIYDRNVAKGIDQAWKEYIEMLDSEE